MFALGIGYHHANVEAQQDTDSEGAVVSLRPAPPENASVVHNSLTEVQLTWDASPSPAIGIGSYTVFYKLSSDLSYPPFPQITRLDSLASYSETIPVLANTGYDFKIYANTPAGVSSSNTCASCEVSNTFCGDGVIEAGEMCDGVNLGGAACADFGYTGGTLGCNLSCTYSFLSCISPGGGGGPNVDTLNPIPGTASSPEYANSSPVLISYSGANDPGGSGLNRVELWYKKGTGIWKNSGLKDTGFSGSFEFPPPGGTNGIYYFDLVAYDNEGNSSPFPGGSGDTQTIYDITPPTIEAVDMPKQTTQPIGITYTNAIDPAITSVSQVELWYKKGVDGAWINTGQIGPEGSASFFFDGFQGSGAYYFDLIAEDLAGNRSIETYEYQEPVLYDVDVPIIALAEVSQAANETLFIAYEGAEDIGPAGLKAVELWVRHESSNTWQNTGLSLPDVNGTFEFTPQNGAGLYFFEFVLEDNFGNKTEIPVGEGSLNVGIDSIPFDVVLTNLPNRLTQDDSTDIGVTGNNLAAYRFSIDDSPFSLETSADQNIQLKNLKEGLHTIEVIGKRTDGLWQNENEAVAYTWRVDSSLPRVRIIGPFLPFTIKERTIIKGANFELHYSDYDRITLTEEDISLTFTGTAEGLIDLTQRDESTWVVEITDVVGVGTIKVIVAPGTALGINGNRADGVTSSPLNVNIQFLEDDPFYVQLLGQVKGDIVPPKPIAAPTRQRIETEAKSALQKQILISGQAYQRKLPRLPFDPSLNLSACQVKFPQLDFDSETADEDDDQLSNRNECYFSSNPLKPDTDRDGCLDGLEVNWLGTDPNDPTDCPFTGDRQAVWITSPQNGWSISALEIMGLTPDNSSYTDLIVFPVLEGTPQLNTPIDIGRVESFSDSQVDGHHFFNLNSGALLKQRLYYDLVAVSTLSNGEVLTSLPVRFWLDDQLAIDPPKPTAIGGIPIERTLSLTNVHIGPTDDGHVQVTGESEYGAQVYAVWQSSVLTSTTIVDSQQGRFSITSPEVLESDQEHQVILYALKENKGQVLKSKNVAVDFYLHRFPLFYYLFLVLLIRLIFLIIIKKLKKYEENIDSQNKLQYNLDSNKTKTLFYNQNKMNKVMQNTLAVLGGAALGIVGFNLYVGAQTDTDTITATVRIPGTVSITDDGVNFQVDPLNPGITDTSQESILTVESNVAAGFNVTVGVEDLEATANQLCEDDGIGGCTANVFSTDNGTASFLSVTSDVHTGSLNLLTGATFLAAETNLNGAVQVFTATEATNSDVFRVSYDVGADNTAVPATYEGVITFTITAL